MRTGNGDGAHSAPYALYPASKVPLSRTAGEGEALYRTVTFIDPLYDACPSASTALTRKVREAPTGRPVTRAVVEFAAAVAAGW